MNSIEIKQVFSESLPVESWINKFWLSGDSLDEIFSECQVGGGHNKYRYSRRGKRKLLTWNTW